MRAFVKCSSWLIDKWNLIFSWWNTHVQILLYLSETQTILRMFGIIFRMFNNHRKLQRTGRIQDMNCWFSHDVTKFQTSEL